MSNQDKQPSQEKGKPITFWQMVASVLMSFLGVQRGSVRERDFEHGKPIHFIAIGLVLTILFILAIALIVKIILAQAGVS